MNIIADNIARLKAEIGKTELIAVSKKQPVEKLREALIAGQYIYGENRVQEAAEKFPALREEFKDIELHLIGPLQTNKVKDALELFDVIQTVDREKLAVKIAAELRSESAAEPALSVSEREQSMQKGSRLFVGRTKEFFVQVNIGEEEQKAGIAPQEAEEFVLHCINDLGLNVTGLMCIPPVDEPAFMYFGLLKKIAQQVQERLRAQRRQAQGAQSHAALELSLKLSMGMSADYQQAVEMGADYVRIGTGVFGAREY